jgi:hypothetical protein
VPDAHAEGVIDEQSRSVAAGGLLLLVEYGLRKSRYQRQYCQDTASQDKQVLQPRPVTGTLLQLLQEADIWKIHLLELPETEEVNNNRYSDCGSRQQKCWIQESHIPNIWFLGNCKTPVLLKELRTADSWIANLRVMDGE